MYIIPNLIKLILQASMLFSDFPCVNNNNYYFTCVSVCESWTYGVNCRNSCFCNQTQTERFVEFAEHKMSLTCTANYFKAVYLVSNTNILYYRLNLKINIKIS